MQNGSINKSQRIVGIMTDIVWSINIMIGVLMFGVSYFVYYILTYDD